MTVRIDQNWKPLVAALLNQDSRIALAEVILGNASVGHVPGLSDKKAHAALQKIASLTVSNASGDLTLDLDYLQKLLACGSAQQTHSRDLKARFLHPDGRLKTYPSKLEERRELLGTIADELFTESDELTEKAVNATLLTVTSDFVTMRRYLVDFGILTRTKDGTSYQRGEVLEGEEKQKTLHPSEGA